MQMILLALSKVAIDSFVSGAVAAISLYCGVNTPLGRRTHDKNNKKR